MSYPTPAVSTVHADNTDTMITIAAKPCKEVLRPIYDRLEDDSSLLRRAGDVSMLAQALLDVCELSTLSDGALCPLMRLG